MTEFFPHELAITQWANGFHSGVVGACTSFMYAAFQPLYAAVIVTVIAALLSRRDARRFLSIGATVALTWLPVVAIKQLAHRPRPDASLLPHPLAMLPGDWSFPSGHVAFAMALTVTVFLFTRHRLARTLAALFVPLMAATVLVVGVHYITDVLFSLVWSAAIAPLVFRLVCRVGSRLPARSESNRAQSSAVRSARTYPR